MFNARSMFVKQIFKHEGLLDDASSCRSTASSLRHISRDDGLSVILSKVVCDGDGWDQCERSEPLEHETRHTTWHLSPRVPPERFGAEQRQRTTTRQGRAQSESGTGVSGAFDILTFGGERSLVRCNGSLFLPLSPWYLQVGNVIDSFDKNII
ncbi:hypothetical protein ACHAXS_008488 [Conticribra weissflogii]